MVRPVASTKMEISQPSEVGLSVRNHFHISPFCSLSF